MCLLLECTDGVSHIWKAVEWAVLILQCMLLCMETELFANACNFISAEHGRYGLSYMLEDVELAVLSLQCLLMCMKMCEKVDEVCCIHLLQVMYM